MKPWFQDNVIEMYSTHNEGKSVVAEKYIRILGEKIYKYMTLISENVYFEKLVEIVNKYVRTYHDRSWPVDLKSSAHINFDKKNHVRPWWSWKNIKI